MTATIAVRTVPRVIVECDGSRATRAESDRILSCRVAQRVSLPDQVEVSFRDSAPDGATPDRGLRVQLDSGRVLFDGTISRVEHVLGPDGSVTVRVRGYDRLHALRRIGKVTAWTNTSVAGLARELVGSAGLSVAADADGPTLRRVIQRGQSDLDLLRSLARRAGLGLHCRGDLLAVYDLAEGTGDPVALTWGANLRSGEVADNPGAGGRPVHVEGTDVTRVMHAGHDESGGDGATRNLVGLTLLGDAEPAALAHADAVRQQCSAATLRGVADGDPMLRPGAVVSLCAPTGLGSLARRVVLTEVVHAIDDLSGYTSQFTSVPPAADDTVPDGLADGCTLILATVSDVDDPDSAGRVKVTLDAYGDVETEWLPVLSASAGSKGGLISQPDVGDSVLLLSSRIDPGWGVLLGGLYPERLPEAVVDGGRTRRQVWTSSGGQRIGLDDVANSVTVSDHGGSKLELTPDIVRLLATCDLEISAPGKAIRITASTVDFVQG